MSPTGFTIVSISATVVLALVLFWKFRDRRSWWYALIVFMLIGLLTEHIADTYIFVMDYSWQYPMIPGTRLPLMIPFAHAVFFAVPLILLDAQRSKIDRKLTKWQQFVVLEALFIIWDFAIEYSSIGSGLWIYY